MLIKNQKIEVAWNSYTKKWYVEHGYTYTKCGDKFTVDIKDLKLNSCEIVKVKCDYCGIEKEIKFRDYNRTTENGKKKYACKQCGGKKNAEQRIDKNAMFNFFIDMCKDNNFEPISTINDYKNASSKLKYICPKHGLQETPYASIKYEGTTCKYCNKERNAKILSKSQLEVVSIVESKNNNKLLNPHEYRNVFTKNLKIKCGSCGEIFISSLSSIMNCKGSCSKCGIKKSSEQNKLSPEEVEKIVNSINGNTLLNANEYVRNSTVNLKIKCGQCGEIFTTSLANYVYNQTNRCRSCSFRISKGEKIIADFLTEHNINYEQEKKFSECKDKKCLPFDFYLPDYNTCIEFDGQLHYMPIYGEERLVKTQLHDKIKNDFCNDNNIILIRIPYWDGNNIDKLLSKELNLNNKIA